MTTKYGLNTSSQDGFPTIIGPFSTFAQAEEVIPSLPESQIVLGVVPIVGTVGEIPPDPVS